MAREQVELAPESWRDFDEFYRSTDKRIMRFVMRLGATRQEAEDAVHDAMAKVFSSWDRMAHPSAYARVAAERAYLRSRARLAREGEKVAQAGWNISTNAYDPESVIFKQEAREVLAALRMLPFEQRRVMAWHLDHYSTHEIAAIVGKPESTVRSNLRHARARLKEWLDHGRVEAARVHGGHRADRKEGGR